MVFDQTCELWDHHCGDHGSCLSYNLQSLSMKMLALNVTTKLASLIFMVLSWKLYTPPKVDTEGTSDTRVIINDDRLSVDPYVPNRTTYIKANTTV